MKLIFTISAVLLASALLMTANKYLPNIDITLNKNTFINTILKYQVLAFVVALVVLYVTLLVTPESKRILNFGNISTIAQKETWLGINGKTSWKSNGIQLMIFISIATSIFMFIAVKYTDSLSNFKWAFIPIILLVSLTNSFSEEIIYRFAINGNLIKDTSKLTIFIISAILFGLPHYLGYPSGIIGIIMAGLLGYIISKATYETNGIGIAWTIHFVQDVIIFSALFMMNVKS